MNISKKHYTQGEVPTAAELNAPYDDLATASASVEADNTASAWATIKHFDTSASQCNRLAHFNDTSTGVHAINSTTYVTINVVSLSEINFTGFFPDANEATRYVASGLVRGTTVGVDEGSKNYYAFRLLLTYNDGGADVTTTIGEWGYSLTARALVTDQSGGVANKIQYQTFQFSAVRRYDGATGAREYKKIELQCKVNDALNTVEISRNQIFVISGRR